MTRGSVDIGEGAFDFRAASTSAGDTTYVERAYHLLVCGCRIGNLGREVGLRRAARAIGVKLELSLDHSTVCEFLGKVVEALIERLGPKQ